MPEATLTSRWQMVLPKPIREHLKLHPGDRLDFLIRENGEVVVRPVALEVRELEGLLYRPGRPAVSVEKMKRVVRERARRSV